MCGLFGVFLSAFPFSSSPSSSSSLSSSYQLLHHIQILPSLGFIFIPFPFYIFLFIIRLFLLTIFLLFLVFIFSSFILLFWGRIRIDGVGWLFSIGLKSLLIKYYLRIEVWSKERANHVALSGSLSVLGRGTSKCKGPEEGTSLTWWSRSQRAS